MTSNFDEIKKFQKPALSQEPEVYSGLWNFSKISFLAWVIDDIYHLVPNQTDDSWQIFSILRTFSCVHFHSGRVYIVEGSVHSDCLISLDISYMQFMAVPRTKCALIGESTRCCIVCSSRSCSNIWWLLFKRGVVSVQEKGSWKEPHDLNGLWPWGL